MEAFFTYLIKSIICLILFLVVYAVFFRRTTFIVFNRIYLLFGLLVSLILPAYTFTYDVMVNVDMANIVPTAGQTQAENPVAAGTNWWQVVLMIYIAGIALLTLRNILAYIKIARLIRSGIRYNSDGIKLVNNENIKSPFSVLNYVILNTKELSVTEKELIIKHEVTHVKQKHWIDLICGQCMLVLQWFNPFVWLYVSYLKENHEFLADKAVLNGGVSPATYQAVLINRQFGGPVFSFANSFNYSKPLTRLIMMKKTKSSPIHKIALLTLIPIFGAFVWITAKPRYIAEYNDPAINNAQDSTTMTVITSNADLIEGEEPYLALKDAIIVKDDNPPLLIIDGKDYPYSEIHMIDPIYIESMNTWRDKDAISKYGDKGKNGVIEIVLKKGYDYRALKKQRRNISIAIVNEDDNGRMTIYNPDDNITLSADSISFNRKSMEREGKITVIDTGKKGKPSETIHSIIDVRTNDNDTAKVKVITKVVDTRGKIDNTYGPLNIQLNTIDARGENPLIIIDGKEKPYQELNSIDHETIEAITVLKGKSATDKYGDKAKNGILEITTKK